MKGPSVTSVKRRSSKSQSASVDKGKRPTINITPSELLLIGDEPGGINGRDWRCTVVLLEEGSSDYTPLVRLLNEAVIKGRRRHVAVITYEQLLSLVKQARPRERLSVQKGRHSVQGSMDGSKDGGSNTFNPDPSLVMDMNPEPIKQGIRGHPPSLATSNQPSKQTSKTSKLKIGDGGDVGSNIAQITRNAVLAAAIEEALSSYRTGMELSTTTVARLVRGELDRIREDAIQAIKKEIERKKRLNCIIDLLSDKPILQTVFEGSKEYTRLRKRGAPAARMTAIEDQPLRGSDLYVILTGFHLPELPVELLRAGVPLRAVVLLYSEEDEDDAFDNTTKQFSDARIFVRSWPFVNQAMSQATVKVRKDDVAAKEQADLQEQEVRANAAAAAAAARNNAWTHGGSSRMSVRGHLSSKQSFGPSHQSGDAICRFWPEYDRVLWDPAKFDELRDVAMHTITIPKDVLKGPEEEIKNFLYDEASFVAYDMHMTERVWKSYRSSMKKVNLTCKKQPINEAPLYRSIMKSLPLESWDIPLRLRAILQQVEQWLSTSSTDDIISRKISIGPMSDVDVVKSELEDFLYQINKQFDVPDRIPQGRKEFPDPLVLVHGDSALQRGYHVYWSYGDISNATVDILGTTVTTRGWNMLPPASSEHNKFSRFFMELSRRLSSTYGVRSACADSLLEMVAFTRMPCSSGACPEVFGAWGQNSVRSPEGESSTDGVIPFSFAATATDRNDSGSFSSDSRSGSRGPSCSSFSDVTSCCPEDMKTRSLKALSRRYNQSQRTAALVAPPTVGNVVSVPDLLRFLLEMPRFEEPPDPDPEDDSRKKSRDDEKSKKEGSRKTKADDDMEDEELISRIKTELSEEVPEPANARYTIEAHRFARERSPNILMQQIFEAQVDFQCLDVAYFRPTDVLLVRAHNPVDENGIWRWSYEASLPTCKLGLREFVDCSYDEIPEWIDLETERIETLDEVKGPSSASIRLKTSKVTSLSKMPFQMSSLTPGTISPTVTPSAKTGSLDTTDEGARKEVDPMILPPSSLKYLMLIGEPDVRRRRSFSRGLAVAASTPRRTTRPAGATLTAAQGGVVDANAGGFNQGSSSTMKSIKTGSMKNKRRRGKEIDASMTLVELEEGSGEVEIGGMAGSIPSEYDTGSGLSSYELGTRRWQLAGEKRRFAAVDGSSMLVDVTDWLYRRKTMSVTVNMSGNTVVLHRNIAHAKHGSRMTNDADRNLSDSASDRSFQPKRPFAFHVTAANGIILSFSSLMQSGKNALRRRARGGGSMHLSSMSSFLSTQTDGTQSQTPTTFSISPAPTAEHGSQTYMRRPSTSSNRSEEDRFLYNMKMSWPSGLIVEVIKTNKNPLYIRQYYISKGPESSLVEHELWRAFAPDGTILKFMDKRRVLSLAPNASVNICKEFNPPLESAWPKGRGTSPPSSPSGSPNRQRTPGGRVTNKRGSVSGPNEGSRRGNGASNAGTLLPGTAKGKRKGKGQKGSEEPAQATTVENRRVTKLETVQPEGAVYTVSLPEAGDRLKDEWKQIHSYILRSHTDFEVLETLMRRGDGTVILFKPNGAVTAHFPDSSRITSAILDEEARKQSPKPHRLKVESTTLLAPGRLSALPEQTSTSNIIGEVSMLQKHNPITEHKEKSDERETKRPHTSSRQGNRSRKGPPSDPMSEDGEENSGGKSFRSRSRQGGGSDKTSPLAGSTNDDSPDAHSSVRYRQDFFVYAASASPKTPQKGRGSLSKGKTSSNTSSKRSKGRRHSGTLSTDEFVDDNKRDDKRRSRRPKDDKKSKRDAGHKSDKDILAASKDDPKAWDEFEDINVSYTMEHPNYATVVYNTATGVTNLEAPGMKVAITEDGTYRVEMKGSRHEMGETTVILSVEEDRVVMDRRLIVSGDVTCHCNIDPFTFMCDVPDDAVVCQMVDSEGRCFDVLASGDSSYRRATAGDQLVFSDSGRYFLVHRDLTGLELCTAKMLRTMVRLTQADPRGIFLSQVDSKQPDLSYHVSLLPLKSVSEQWLLPLETLKLTSEEQRSRLRRLRLTGSAPDYPLRSTYGHPPNWFHPFPLHPSVKRKKQEESGDAANVSSDSDEDPLAVPDPLLVDMLAEIVPYKLRLRRALHSALQAVCKSLHVPSSADSSSRSSQAETPPSEGVPAEIPQPGDGSPPREGRVKFSLRETQVEIRRRRSGRLRAPSRVRPTWQEKTTSPAALKLYYMAIHRRLAMTKSEENLFQRKAEEESWQRGMAAAMRAQVREEEQRLLAILRSGKGNPYFSTERGKAILANLPREAPRKAKGQEKGGGEPSRRGRNLVQEATRYFTGLVPSGEAKIPVVSAAARGGQTDASGRMTPNDYNASTPYDQSQQRLQHKAVYQSTSSVSSLRQQQVGQQSSRSNIHPSPPTHSQRHQHAPLVRQSSSSHQHCNSSPTSRQPQARRVSPGNQGRHAPTTSLHNLLKTTPSQGRQPSTTLHQSRSAQRMQPTPKQLMHPPNCKCGCREPQECRELRRMDSDISNYFPDHRHRNK